MYDSASNLIKNTFTFDKVGKAASERFREKAQFSLRDVTEAMSGHTDDLIPLGKLVKLLEYRNVLTVIQSTPLPEGATSSTAEPTFFMPCVLRSARADDLHVCTSKELDPAPLMLHFDVPIGGVPCHDHQPGLSMPRMIEGGLRKNRIQFYVGGYYDTVTLILHPCYFEVVILRSQDFETPTQSMCAHVHKVIESTLRVVTWCMNYHFSMGYKLGFECPAHPGREHLCVLAGENAKKMKCLQNLKEVQPISLKPQHRVWFSAPAPSRNPSLSGEGGKAFIFSCPYAYIAPILIASQSSTSTQSQDKPRQHPSISKLTVLIF